ncbi:uncharacterized protein AMSG_02354 [Thecamonas trahens ATCC 50062]|uniref:Uncharacterized protein n=1 Tax=Thecamonas trahens ATCC 50062 TaxID=461836 RepID=A0A0L0DVY9_THETB|nr:hypothetical protein AMSG_02354 [Thecamonas trahens ATCC 50062]KNC56385.1 hypothetical protein AMSG_02354 [Thecamonas trahens ATCC 50062]|eukprot:XP_013760899.1 hypothetical protein AMSG_02354 [Thecamonas trahens ATCC 50062]
MEITFRHAQHNVIIKLAKLSRTAVRSNLEALLIALASAAPRLGQPPPAAVTPHHAGASGSSVAPALAIAGTPASSSSAPSIESLVAKVESAESVRNELALALQLASERNHELERKIEEANALLASHGLETISLGAVLGAASGGAGVGGLSSSPKRKRPVVASTFAGRTKKKRGLNLKRKKK